jgi:hypothetical protein
MPQRQPPTLECQRCQARFQSKHYKASRPNPYCSRDCSAMARRCRVLLQCRQCRQEFDRKAYMADWSKGRGPFCGFACYGAWQKENTTGEANPNFVAESSARGAGKLSRNRLAALERDGRACCRCGKPGGSLHVHHVRHWSPEERGTHDVGNLLTLCASCHRKAHPLQRGTDGKFLPNQ